jgi:hypothetical protein
LICRRMAAEHWQNLQQPPMAITSAAGAVPPPHPPATQALVGSWAAPAPPATAQPPANLLGNVTWETGQRAHHHPPTNHHHSRHRHPAHRLPHLHGPRSPPTHQGLGQSSRQLTKDRRTQGPRRTARSMAWPVPMRQRATTRHALAKPSFG